MVSIAPTSPLRHQQSASSLSPRAHARAQMGYSACCMICSQRQNPRHIGYGMQPVLQALLLEAHELVGWQGQAHQGPAALQATLAST